MKFIIICSILLTFLIGYSTSSNITNNTTFTVKCTEEYCDIDYGFTKGSWILNCSFTGEDVICKLANLTNILANKPHLLEKILNDNKLFYSTIYCLWVSFWIVFHGL